MSSSRLALNVSTGFTVAFAGLVNDWNTFHSIRMRSMSWCVSPSTGTSSWTIPNLMWCLQSIMLKRSPRHRETRKKWEKVTSTSLALGSKLQVAVAYCVCTVQTDLEVTNLLLPSCGSGWSGEGAWALHAQTAQTPPRTPETSGHCQSWP